MQLDMARREAETAICAWNDFLAVMNHEMWTPMHTHHCTVISLAEFYPVQGEQHCYIRVEVQDTGEGLNPQDIQKLFNKFLQADSTTTRNHSGTGLGVAICKRLLIEQSQTCKKWE
jgi:K+-sensing histidine kinase KdpD